MRASADRRMTAEDAVAITELSQAAISPDGVWVAYVRSRPVLTAAESTRRGHIWIVRAEGGEPVQLTNGANGDGQPHWSPDGARLAFVSRRGDGVAQVWALRVGGGEAWQVTRSATAVSNPRWAPDGSRIAYTAVAATDPGEELRRNAKDDAVVVGADDFDSARLWVTDVAEMRPDDAVEFDADGASDERPPATMLTGDAFHVAAPEWAPDGTRIAFVASPTPKADDTMFASVIRIVDDAGGESRKLTTFPGGENSPRWAPDGRRIAFTRSPEGYGQADLYVVESSGGAATCLTEALDRTTMNPRWTSDGAEILFEARLGVERHVMAAPLGGGAVRTVTTGRHVVGAMTVAANGDAFAAITSTPDRPPAIVVGNAAAGFGSHLIESNPQLADVARAETRVLRWTSSDGLSIEGILVLPPDADGKPFPLIVEPHGGPHGGARDMAFRQEWQYFAAEGFGIFSPNFRGSDGYGRAFARGNFADWGGGDHDDIMTGLDTLIAQGVADPERLVVAGWSYGGYMTAWMISQTDRFKAAMCGCGISNAFSMYGTTDIPRFMSMYFGDSSPAEQAALYRERSGLSHAAAITTPTLILHGEEDRRVPISQSEELHALLKATGVETEFVRYPREGHGISEPRHRLDLLRRQVAWYRRHLGMDSN